MRLSRFLLCGALAGAACAGTERYEPPARTDAVRAEEARVAALVADQQRWPGRARPSCAVRVLGIDGPTSYAWADCSVPASGDAPSGGWSAPYRIEGTTVRGPADGAGYAASVRELFPEPLAEAILDHRADLRPAP
ncbi:MAG TPA: hypothetical protein VNA14_11865 [Mycobacteriales bacterium]|nr:hypothetical protein [Mycobacteriales bacterium]